MWPSFDGFSKKCSLITLIIIDYWFGDAGNSSSTITSSSLRNHRLVYAFIKLIVNALSNLII
jgi:hypothetical protein